MFLRPDDVLKYGPCPQGYSFLSRYFPDGAELSDVMRHKYTTEEFLHWGFDNLSTNDDEKKLYYELLDINCEHPETIYHSRDIDCSYRVSDSKSVYNSHVIHNCHDIRDSAAVSDSEEVHQSWTVVKGSFIFTSKFVANSQNITDCEFVVGSQFVVDSHSVMNSEQVESSKWIRDCANVEDCFMCADCRNLKHAMFCSDIEGEYMIFNKPVEPKRFELIKKQLMMMLAYFHMDMATWDEGMYETKVKINLNYITQYAAVPTKFWSWLKTLPGYDPMVMYRITFQPHLLD